MTEIKIKAFVKKYEKNNAGDRYEYKVEAKISACEKKIQPDRKKAGRFILATNVLNKETLNSEEMLDTYKNGQQSVERGFRFLNPQNESRRDSLIMALSLLVYKVAERQIRQILETTGAKVKNQLGALTARPTLRWLFQCFQSIHVYSEGDIKRVSNLNLERLHLLKFFPPSCQRYYLVAD